MNLNLLSREYLEELIEIHEELHQRSRRNAVAHYFTNSGEFSREKYVKQLDFFNAGREYKLRLFMSANRIGKTLAAAYELTCHLTGIYPDWWTGKRFKTNSEWWVCGVDSKLILSTLQPMLLGQVGDFGTGMIPYDLLDFDTLKDAKKADTGVSVFRVKHITGTYSSVEFKSYESGRETFQGTARSIWLDEEPPISVFTECLLRTATGDNALMMTFTPLKGISETIMNFLDGSQFREGAVGIGKWVTMASWDDVPHLSETDKAILLASIPPFQRDARTKGIPQLGAGAVYPVPESEYLCDVFEIPKHWKRFYALDVGWARTAALWFAIDPDTQIKYLYYEHYKGESEPSIHAQGIKMPGNWIHGVIDTAARGRSQIDGENLMQMYTDLGLHLHDANKSVETGLYKAWEQLSIGQIKVFRTLKNFMDEIRIYRRDEKGKIIKTKDHLMDCFRYGIMSDNAYAKTEIESVRVRKPGSGLPTPGGWA
jgi:phage terminase large subunit-like protein